MLDMTPETQITSIPTESPLLTKYIKLPIIFLAHIVETFIFLWYDIYALGNYIDLKYI